MWIVKHKIKKDNRMHYEVQCRQCGYTKLVRVSQIYDDKTCKKCNTILRNRKSLGQHRGIGGLTRTFYNYFRNNARRRKIEFLVTINELWEIACKQGNKCALTGLPISFPTTTDGRGNSLRDESSASLDRIDSNFPYSKDNVQWVHKYVNVMKNGFGMDEFIYFCHLVSQRHANPEPSSLIGNKKVREKVQRLIGEDTQSNKPDTSARHPLGDDDIVRHSREIWRATHLKKVA